MVEHGKAMSKRKIADAEVHPVAMGCMNVSHAYGPGPPEGDSIALLQRALDLGVDCFDTASIYGGGSNEVLVGKALGHRRNEIFLASKCVMGIRDGKRVLDARPETIHTMCDQSLKSLGVDVIDLYYMHRPDRKVPIEESVGAMKELVEAGKIRHVGLSEMGAGLLRRAHAVHPIAAMQSEYSLWTRNPEIAVLDACEELGIAFVAFSPVGRGFLSDSPPSGDFHEHDIRRSMPRFHGDHLENNRVLLTKLQQVARDLGWKTAQVAIAWVLAQRDCIVALPGTTQREHLEENHAAGSLALPPEVEAELSEFFTPERISGPRYSEPAQASVDTEQFEFEQGVA